MSLVSVAIQAHPARAEIAEGLAACLDGVDVVYDPEPDIAPRSPWRTYRRALERGLDAPAGTTHRLVLQEDVLVCDRFLEGIELAAAVYPDRPILFYVGGRPPEHANAVYAARRMGRSWADLSNRVWVSAVATAWPVAEIARMLGVIEAQPWPPEFVADDEILGRYLQIVGETAVATVPSLVEHPDTVPSVAKMRRGIGGLDPGRRAAVWIGDLGICDATAIDWSA